MEENKNGLTQVWKSYLAPTPVNVKKWLLAIKGIMITASGAAYFSSHETMAFWIALATGAINELANILSE